MRILALLAVLALAVPAAAAARPGEKGDGTFAVKNATGRIAVVAKGAALGRVDDGTLVITDLTANGSDEIQVSGYDQKPVTRGNGTTVYRGDNMRFRVVGGWYSVTVTGTGITLSAVGKGSVQGQAISDGLFSSDGAPFRPVPAVLYADAFGQS